jgi:glycosyltransferase involved in cell wall biosynthesis
MKLLMISTDRKIFEKDSAVAQRQIEYAKKYEEVHIIIFTLRSTHKYAETVVGTNVWAYPTNSRSRWLCPFDALSLGRFIVKKRKITDVTCQDPFETGLVGALIKNREPVSLELQIHTDIGSPYFQNFNFLNKIRTLISKYTLPRADHIRAVSYRIQEYVRMYVDPSRITVKPIAVDVERIKNAPITINLHSKYPQFSKICLMASRLEPEKNTMLALEAWSKVLQSAPDAGLVIVGSGSEEQKLKRYVIEKGMEKSVVFEGWQDDMASYYKSCDVFLVTSLYEGYGMTLIEAQAAGCKIVSTDVGVAKEIGAEIVKNNPESLAIVLLNIIGYH